MTSVRTLSLAIAALLTMVVNDAAAQNQRPIRGPDVAAAQAQDVYQLVEKLRPDWLWMAGDPADAASRANVRVWVDNTQVGGLEALRGLTVARLHSVRLVGREVARARDPRTDASVAGALLVRYDTEAPGPGRIEISAGLGRRGELESRAREGMVEAGFDLQNRIWTNGVDRPLAYFLTAKLRLRDQLGISVNALYTGGHNVRGIPGEPPFISVSNRFSTADLAAQVFAERSSFRLGAGPALRMLRYTQTRGSCECEQAVEGSQVVLGGGADLGVASPAYGPMQLELVYGARWFPSHTIPPYQGAPELELGGFTTYLTLGAAFGF